jgi:alkylation response protein AidB-like acyl-CoA dehydrogenase
MDFGLTDEQKDVQKAAVEFAKGEFDPDLAFELDRTRQFPESIWKRACKLGFIGIHYPEEFGGQGLGVFENILVIEAFCRVDSGIGSSLSMVDIGSEVILNFGSREQKVRFLLPLTKGKKQLSIAIAESEDENDISSISTIAKMSGEGYLLRGKKKFVLNASLANIFIILCKEPVRGYITLVVDREEEGLEITPVEKMGLKMIPFGDLHFKELRVPLENLVGREGEGMLHISQWYQMMGLRTLAQALGVAEGAFDRAREYAKQREQFGKKLSQLQIIRHKLADMAVSVEVARWLTYRSAVEYDQGRIETNSLPIAQVEAGRRLIGVVDEALQIFGGYGYMAEQAIEHYYRDAWAIGALLGTEEELNDIIAESILGPVSLK